MHLHGDRRIYTGKLDELICLCLKVHRNKILETIEGSNLTTVAQVRRGCRAGGGCGSCHEEIARLITERRLGLTLDFGNHIIEKTDETSDEDSHDHFHDDLEFFLSQDHSGKNIELNIIKEAKQFIEKEINPYLAKFDVSAQVIESSEELVIDLIGADQELKYTLGFWLDQQFHKYFPTITVIIA
jgi:bacterioferritin-associated ferredoxin